MAGTRRPALAPPRDRVLSGPELAAIWRVTEDEPEGRYAWRCYCRIIRLLMLLGGRANEVGGMKWSEFDLGAGTWTLPKERSKNHRPLTLMLPKVALDIVATGERRAEGERLRNGTPKRLPPEAYPLPAWTLFPPIMERSGGSVDYEERIRRYNLVS